MSDDHTQALAPAPAPEQSISPDRGEELHPMIRLLAQQGELTPETIERMMALQERHDAHLAEQLYNEARARLLDDLPSVVAKNKRGAFGPYADLPQIMRAVMPALRQHGFSVSWTSAQEGRDEIVTCHLIHRCGHEATNTRRGCVDAKKGLSSVQSSQLAVTYLQRHTLCALLGIVSGDMPDADERRRDPQGVDPSRNLRAVSAITKAGKTTAWAEELIGRTVAEWTSSDLDRLREELAK